MMAANQPPVCFVVSGPKMDSNKIGTQECAGCGKIISERYLRLF